MVSRRATLVAKQATATRFGAPRIMSVRLSNRSASEPDEPGLNTLVESQTMASTPSSPSWRSAASSDAGPTTGSGSNFQSPVCSTVPRGVRMAMALGSGIEWVRVISSRSKGPTRKRPLNGTSVIGTRSSRPASRSLWRSTERVNLVA